jgi:hypothetical protein
MRACVLREVQCLGLHEKLKVKPMFLSTLEKLREAVLQRYELRDDSFTYRAFVWGALVLYFFDAFGISRRRRGSGAKQIFEWLKHACHAAMALLSSGAGPDHIATGSSGKQMK